MSYLIVQILICLLIAAAIGVFIGWFLRGDCKGVIKEQEEICKIKLDDLEQKYNKKIKSIITEKEGSLKISELILKEHKERIAALENKRVKLESRVAQLAQENIELKKSLQEANEQLQNVKTKLKECLELNFKIQNRK